MLNTTSPFHAFFLLNVLCFRVHAHLPKRQQTGTRVVQISDGQVQVPVVHSKTTLITSIGGAAQTVVLPAGSPPAAPTTIPVNVNGQPNVAVVGPSGIVSFLPPNDILVGTTVITADSTGFRIGTQEVANGKDPVTINGETFSFGSQGLYVDGIPKTLTGKSASSTTQQSSGTGGATTTSGSIESGTIDSGKGTTENSTQTTTTVPPRNTEQVSTTTDSGSRNSTAVPIVIVVGGETIHPVATGFMVGDKTILPGAPAITISGETLSLGTAGELIDDGTTIAVPSQIGGTPAKTTIPMTTSATTTQDDGQASRTTTGTSVAQSSILNATGTEAPTITTLVFGGETEVFSKATFSDLADLSTTKTVRTTVSNHDSGWITAVPIIVLPHGIWWHGGLRTGGGGGFCFWPFCPPGGPPGGGGSSADGDPVEPEETQEEKTKPSQTTTSQKRTTEPPSTTGSSSTESSSGSNYGTITFDGDAIPYQLNDADLRAWGDAVYARMITDGLGEDVTNIDGVYTGATGTPLSSETAGLVGGAGNGSVTRTKEVGPSGTASSRTVSNGPSSTKAPTTTTSQSTTTQAVLKPLSDCVLTTSVVGTTDTTLTAGTYTYCECDSTVIARTSTQPGPSSGTTYIICSGTPFPTVSTIVSSSSSYVPPASQCPNDGVRQNAAGCPTTTTSTGDPLRCSTGSNVGVATYDPATWCGCNGQIYSTIAGATSDYCAYQTVPASTVKPTQVPKPSTTTSVAPATPTADCEFWDEVLFWSFAVYNINGWAGDGGGSLKKQEQGCGGLTGWGWHVDDKDHQHANFNLPFTIKKGCVERAIKSAGGPGGLSCKGHGLKKRSKVPMVKDQHGRR